MDKNIGSRRRRPASQGAIALKVLLAAVLAFISTSSALAQGELGSGTVSGSGNGPFTYSLSFGDAANATSPIGSIWYSWVPGLFFLPSTPTSASAPSGWTATIAANSIQYVANSAANYINPGETLFGFGFEATFSPAELQAAPNSGLSVAYSGGLFSDGGDTFSVVPTTVPEPSSMVLLVAGVTGFCCLAKRKFRGSYCFESMRSRPTPAGDEFV